MQKDMRRQIHTQHKIPYNNQTEQEQADLYQFLTMVLLMPTYFYRSKIFLWMAIFCLLSSFFNKKKNQNLVQYLMVLGMVGMAIFSIYFAPYRQTQPVNK